MNGQALTSEYEALKMLEAAVRALQNVGYEIRHRHFGDSTNNQSQCRVRRFSLDLAKTTRIEPDADVSVIEKLAFLSESV